MAKSKPNPKSNTRAFNRVLERTSTPVYFVNCEYEIQFANQACAQWLETDLDTLTSTTCVYSSQSSARNGNDEGKTPKRCEGLCPPPTLFPGSDQNAGKPEQILGLVSKTDTNDRLIWRTAVMSPMFDEDNQQLGVLVVCGGTDKSPPLPNPVDSATAPEGLHVALAQIRTKTDLRYSLESLVGQSSLIKRIRRQVDTAINSSSDLLITGPPGSGKEHLARTIHSSRPNENPSELITVHCSIADQQLIQQNIKDFVENQPSDQTKQSNWILLLDVDQLGEAAQTEMLGFLQIPGLALRIIATTSCSLPDLLNKKNFSQELTHHISPMLIELISLSKRSKDIPFLAQALLERDNERRERQLGGFTKNAMAQLTEYHWPENVDQLDRVIQAAAENATSNEIDRSDLPDEFGQWLSAKRIGKASEEKIELDAYLESIEKQLIDRALKQAKGNKTKASKLLGISRPKLIRRVQHFELESTTPDFSEIKGDELDESAFEELS